MQLNNEFKFREKLWPFMRLSTPLFDINRAYCERRIYPPGNFVILVIVSLILVFGIGDMALGYSGFMVRGIGLAAVAGVLLNLILPKKIAVDEE